MFLNGRTSAFRRHLWLACLPLWFLVASSAQTTGSTVTFTFDFPASKPSHYVLSMSSDGHTSYVSDGKLSSGTESDAADSWRVDFIASRSDAARVFDLTKRAHYFEGEIDSRKKNLASTGTKTLAYKDAQMSTQATYNYSPVPSVQDLTALFQSMSATLEFGRQLEFYLRYQKLALDGELKQLEEMSDRHQLEELSAIAPVLQKIADDGSVMKVVRARAERLLRLTGDGVK
jgi:hypothetical protein